MYRIITNVVGESTVRWDDKPNGVSKLKWLWRNNLLFTTPYAINAIESLVHEMLKVDAAGTRDVLKKLEKSVSKSDQKKSAP